MMTAQQLLQWDKEVSDAYKRGFTDGAIEAKKPAKQNAEPLRKQAAYVAGFDKENGRFVLGHGANVKTGDLLYTHEQHN